MNLGVGIYSVMVMDVNGCIDDMFFIIDVSDDFVVNGISKNFFCFVDGIGEVIVNFIGGIFFYIYQWNNGFMVFVILGVFVGFYSVIVMDENGCMVFQIFVIFQFIEIQVDVNVGGLVCFGDMNGIVMVMVSGGMFFYIYEWSIGVII